MDLGTNAHISCDFLCHFCRLAADPGYLLMLAQTPRYFKCTVVKEVVIINSKYNMKRPWSMQLDILDKWIWIGSKQFDVAKLWIFYVDLEDDFLGHFLLKNCSTQSLAVYGLQHSNNVALKNTKIWCFQFRNNI